jgi:hypothetical protein
MPGVPPPNSANHKKSINRIKTYAFAYGGRANAIKNAFAQRAGISKHITDINYKTYNCKITNFIVQNNNLQV